MKMSVEEIRRKKRPKKRWLDTIENNMRAVGVCRACGKSRQVEV